MPETVRNWGYVFWDEHRWADLEAEDFWRISGTSNSEPINTQPYGPVQLSRGVQRYPRQRRCFLTTPDVPPTGTEWLTLVITKEAAPELVDSIKGD